jgi:hypothetical protein
MALTRHTMTDEQRKSVAIEYLKAFDNGGKTSDGGDIDGPWRAGVPEWAAGRWSDVFEIRDWKIQRCFIYLDSDYAGRDTARYPWLPQK